MTETSSTSSIATTLGAGSGIDMSALASQLSKAQYEDRIERLNTRTDTLEAQISSASSIKNVLSQFVSALGDRVRTGDLSPRPAIANASVASVSSPLGTAGSGSYTLEVETLATGQRLSTPAFASRDTAVGAGSLTFRFGSTTASGFTADGAQEPVTVEIPSGATLADVASAINAKKPGVTAYVAQTSSGAQLVLKGAEGQQNGFIVEASETPGEEGLAALAWNPSSGGDPARLLATSGDASYKLDGLQMTSASNDLGEVAPGLALKLSGTNSGAPTTITFGNPAENITTMMGDLVQALNQVLGELLPATDALTGDLARDPGARALRQAFSQLSSTVIMPNAPEGSPRTLAELGLSTQRDGTFTLDSAQLSRALAADPEGVAAMFTPGLHGVYSTLYGIERSALSTADPGSLASSIARYQAQTSDVADALTEVADKQEALRASLASRFTRADSRIAASQSTLTFLQQQIDAWNAGK
ncbi:flagellar hook protein [Altererythrobacter sp. B11]|uniref:flagellar filament capping protein FliD n=1 Tax=Altererythrobacter sp. B11 TaxID=2060312 RepID=UPI000DC7023F|nr:flagellar filament capping protein FliD [Altererythrobacter sp. B11]BBC72141.1 flagellar hook protein [Altererythrobacter sp. B11]